MALVFADRVKEGSNTAGTGALTLTGAAAGFQSFSAIGNTNTTYYTIYEQDTGGWEVGIGTYTAAGTLLSRDTVLSSSNAGSLVVFTTADKEVFVTYPAERAVYKNSANTYTVQQTFDALTANSVSSTSAALTTGTVSTTPTSNTDIANKQYVDGLVTQGISYHEPVYVESPNTAGNLTAIYANGGTNINIIDIANGSDLTFFGAPPAVGDQLVTATGNGLVAGTQYWVVAEVGAARQISLTYGGAVITGLTNGSVTIPSRYNDGVGATLTNSGTKAALTVDGVLMTTTKRVLVYNQTNAFENGIYSVTTVGTPDPGGTDWVLTRTTDADTYGLRDPNALGYNDAFFVTNGNTGAGETYVCTTSGDIFFGVTNITFAQISSAQVYSAGTGLSLSPATTFNIANTTVSANTYGSASVVPVFTVNAQGQLTGVTDTNIAIASGAVSGLAASATTDTTNAANITSGTLPSGRLIGGYTQVTAVGTLTAGTWNADTIGITYGGTGQTTANAGFNALAPSQGSNSGKYLTTDGTNTSWGSVVAASAGGVIYENSLVISSNYTLTTLKNGMSVGPITINSGVAVTVPSGQRWVVI